MATPNQEIDLSAVWRNLSANLPKGINLSGIGCVLAVLAVLLLLTLGQSFVLVGAGERAVLFNRFTGLQQYQLGEGLHFILPWVQSPTTYDVKTHTYTMHATSTAEAASEGGDSADSLTALTADGLPVSLDLSVIYHIDPNNVWRLHREIGPQVLEKVVRPQARSYVRMTFAQYPVIDVYGGRRARIVEEINTRLRELFAKNYLVLDEVLLRDVRFSKEFHDAIEQKQVAQQDVERMKFVLDQADKERRRKIIQAEGEAESIRMKAAALAQNPKLVEYEYIQRLPENINVVMSDGRAIVSLGEGAKPGTVAATTGPQSAQQENPNGNQ